MKRIFLFSLLAISLISVSSFAQETKSKLGYDGWNHIGLQVKDLEASKAFYKDIIGMTPVPVPDNLKAIRGWFDAGNGQMIHLLAGRTTPVVNDKNGGHIAMFVVSIEQAEKFLKEKNFDYHKQVRFDGVTQIYFADPDGYLIEINQRAK